MKHPNANPEHVTLELWIRSIAPTVRTARRDRIVDRVRRLADRNVVDAFECNGWTGVVERDDGGEEDGRDHPDQPLRAVLESFERWADRTGRSLEPCFRTRRAESAITGESTVVCRPPTVALAEYHDGELAHVAPSRVDDRVIEIEDRLESLATGRGSGTESAGDGGDGEAGSGTGVEVGGGTDDGSVERSLESSRTRPP